MSGLSSTYLMMMMIVMIEYKINALNLWISPAESYLPESDETSRGSSSCIPSDLDVGLFFSGDNPKIAYSSLFIIRLFLRLLC